MKRLIIMLCFVLLSLTYSSSALEVGEKFHITGCENGELMVPVVNLWSKPGGIINGAKVIGKLSGDGRPELGLKCQGSIVELLEIKQVDGKTYLKIKTIYSDVGWVTDLFLGKKVIE